MSKGQQSDNRDQKGEKRWHQTLLFRTVGVAIIVFVTLFVIITILLKTVTRHGDEFPIPSLTNMPLEQAYMIANQASLKLDVTDSVYIKGMSPGYISRQNPEAGSMVKKGRRILLTINAKSPKRIPMPSLIGLSLRQAKTELESKGLRVGNLNYIDDIATNNVLGQQYGGRDINPGSLVYSNSAIDLILGMNPKDNTTYIPDLTGYRYNIARDIIIGSSLNLSNTFFDKDIKSYSDSLEAVVYRQTPAPSDSINWPLGSRINLYLTKDPTKLPASKSE